MFESRHSDHRLHPENCRAGLAARGLTRGAFILAAVVAASLDRDNWDANTDIIVVVDVSRRRMTWVPRDLWSPLMGDRINAAFAVCGGRLLLDALAIVLLHSWVHDAVIDGKMVLVPGKPKPWWRQQLRRLN